MVNKEIPYSNEIKKLKMIIEKLSNPTSITLLEFNKFKKIYSNMLSGIRVSGFPSPSSFKYPSIPDIRGERPAISKLPTPMINSKQVPLESKLPISTQRPVSFPKIR